MKTKNMTVKMERKYILQGDKPRSIPCDTKGARSSIGNV